MTNLTLEREFPVEPELVFEFVTRQEHLKKWLGPQGMTCSEIDMDLAQGKPWSAVIINSEGGIHKMSGVVTSFEPPHSVDFTWGWHDENDLRGVESNVRFEVEKGKNGNAIFKIIHTNLPDEESAQNHNQGWTSTLTKLEALLT
jgi:uncharacterized protein YndB with AHSA1/START domain